MLRRLQAAREHKRQTVFQVKRITISNPTPFQPHGKQRGLNARISSLTTFLSRHYSRHTFSLESALGKDAIVEPPRRLMFWAHSLLVVSAGFIVAGAVHTMKLERSIEPSWNLRFFLLMLCFGTLAYLLWFLSAGIAATLSKKEMASLLQADAYSYFAFYPLISYQHFRRFPGMLGLIVGILVFFILLKLIFLALAGSGRMRNLVSFSYGSRSVILVSVLAFPIILVAHYAHQASLASYWASTQEQRILSVEGEARTCRLLPAGCSIEFDTHFPEQGSLWFAYGMDEKIAGRLGHASPKRLDIYVEARGLRMQKRSSIKLTRSTGWSDANVDLGQKVLPGPGKTRIKAGGTRLFSWPFDHPLSDAVAVTGPKILASPERGLPNIILITVDALRRDYIHSLGYDRPITPTLDSIAGEGLVFPHAISASTWTVPANFALLSSLPVSKLESHIELVERIAQHTLVEAFADGNYLTAAVTDGGWISSETPFMNGFYIFQEHRCTGAECTAEMSFGKALQVLDSWRDSPVFLWIYIMEVHNTTWHPTGRFGECNPEKQNKWVEEYAASIESFDAAFGDFVNSLKQDQLYDKTIILVTSDHGNAFGELHNDDKYVPCGHGGSPYNEQIGIPIILKPQKEKNLSQGRVINEYVSNIDIAPTLLDLAGLPIPEQFEGISLAGAARGEPIPQDRMIYSDTALGRHSVVSAIRGAQKIIYARKDKDKKKITIYDLAKDPDERIDIFENTPAQQAMVGDMEKFLDDAEEFRASVEEPKPKQALSPELWDQLEKLGYLNK